MKSGAKPYIVHIVTRYVACRRKHCKICVLRIPLKIIMKTKMFQNPYDFVDLYYRCMKNLKLSATNCVQKQIYATIIGNKKIIKKMFKNLFEISSKQSQSPVCFSLGSAIYRFFLFQLVFISWMVTLMVISFLQRRCHPITRCIKKIPNQTCYNVIFYMRRTEQKY